MTESKYVARKRVILLPLAVIAIIYYFLLNYPEDSQNVVHPADYCSRYCTH
ncbi:MAG: hypothetical protein HXS54_18435 [Theionarchaea archaeon]|nr:hypothetical protein [Theionarchaea archaeon]